MLTRRSLGDSPLEHESNDLALLDFIGRDRNGIVSPGAKGFHNSNKVGKDNTPNKKIVSYYIERGIIRRLKTLASVTNRSYSSLVAEGLKKLLMEHGF